MSEQLTAAEREKLIENVKHEIALANLTEILKAMTEKCFRKCIGKPGASLDSSENKCLSMCTDRYMDSWNVVSRAYGNRILREGGGAGGPTFS